MASKKVIIGAVVVVVLVVAIAAIAMSGGSDDDTPKDQVRYNYDLEVIDRYVGTDGFCEYADDGKIFVIAHIGIVNDSFKDGFDLNPLTFQVTCTIDGLAYTQDYTANHPDFGSTADVTEGSTAKLSRVFEVPIGTEAKDCSLGYKYNTLGKTPNMEKDTSIDTTGTELKKPVMRYDLTVSEVSSYTTPYGSVRTPDDGKRFIRVDYVLVNDSYPGSYDVSNFTWSVTADSITYGIDQQEYHDYASDVDLGQGATYKSFRIYEIPEGGDATASFRPYNYVDAPWMELDDSLL